MNIQHILISGRLQEELKGLAERRKDKHFRFVPENETSEQDYAWADAFVGFKPTEGFSFARLQWVHATGAGVDAFLLGREWPNDVLLTRTTGAFGAKIGEYCLGHILSDLQRHSALVSDQASKRWAPAAAGMLQGQTVILFGTGTVGRGVAERLAAFGVRVIGISLSGRRVPGFTETGSLDSAVMLLPEAHWVINTLPLTDATYKLFDEKMFRHMKGAGFINVGRGASVDTRALLQALERQQLRCAILDVFEEEPLPKDSPLWEHPGIRITPHISAVTSPEEAEESLLRVFEHIDKGSFPLPQQVDTQRGY
ncbi:D-2-hydroxyacid dehydrogenase [Paenibacillus filicis]|uniref:D-2-hydroxyacid dehydrogenase n=1 Tax=Paenibacillus gyeongsangnamensis TaxID=3388067 RepID=A0ABT4QGI9_9BACL|nr:D-2-hydroxyacid dehydrogenase [Paenibacillus filicis]MCZ8516004.1 D-2-hydroxyacid dehydrogenase [Paenibacillus filicis]